MAGMRRRTFVLGAGALAAGTAALAAPAVGDIVPDFTLPDAAGKPFALRSLRGRVVVLQWMNPGCPFLKKHYASGSIVALQRETVARGVTWLLVESNDTLTRDYLDPSELVTWLRNYGSPAAGVLMDDAGRVARAFGARTASHSFVIGPQGHLLYAGAVDSIPSMRAEDIPQAVPHLRNALADVLAGRPVAVAVSRPYGCGLMLPQA